jgi:hypothetical protein
MLLGPFTLGRESAAPFELSTAMRHSAGLRARISLPDAVRGGERSDGPARYASEKLCGID